MIIPDLGLLLLTKANHSGRVASDASGANTKRNKEYSANGSYQFSQVGMLQLSNWVPTRVVLFR